MRPSCTGDRAGDLEAGSGEAFLQEPHAGAAGAVTATQANGIVPGWGHRAEAAHWLPGMGQGKALMWEEVAWEGGSALPGLNLEYHLVDTGWQGMKQGCSAVGRPGCQPREPVAG